MRKNLNEEKFLNSLFLEKNSDLPVMIDDCNDSFMFNSYYLTNEEISEIVAEELVNEIKKQFEEIRIEFEKQA